MSDIFEIKTAQIEIKIGDQLFPVSDPKFRDKITIKKEWDALRKQEESMDEDEYLLKAYELNKKTVMYFIPSMSAEFIEDKLPPSSLEVLIKKISQITQDKFGAVIEKAEKK